MSVNWFDYTEQVRALRHMGGKESDSGTDWQGRDDKNKGSEKASNKEQENQTNGRVTVVMADGKLTLQAQSASCEKQLLQQRFNSAGRLQYLNIILS